jgi:hypothetical protein
MWPILIIAFLEIFALTKSRRLDNQLLPIILFSDEQSLCSCTVMDLLRLDADECGGTKHCNQKYV